MVCSDQNSPNSRRSNLCSNFDQLSHVDLTGLNVNDSDTDLASIVPNVQTLVLSKSLISDWSSILSMIRPLSRLETLDLSFNRLKADTAEQNCTVRRVILRRNALQWNDLLGILPLFPSLEELFLAENHITNITRVAEKVVSKLSVLDLDSQLQKFCDWSEACDLGKIGRWVSFCIRCSRIVLTHKLSHK